MKPISKLSLAVLVAGGILTACGSQTQPTTTATARLESTITPLPTLTPSVASWDFSDFTHFTYAQERPPGPFCPGFGIFEADISRRPGGGYLLRISIAERGVSEVDQCLDTSPSDVCVKIIQLPERTLTPAEVDAVLDAFREVEVVSYTPYEVECEQPCLREYYTWDSFGVADGICYLPRLGVEQGQVLMNLLSQLAAKSREGLPTATPRPHRCSTYDFFPTYIWDIEIAPDHTVWIASGMGAARYDPVQNNWTTHTTEQGLPSNETRTVTIEDRSVWLTFWDEVGVSHYDEGRWRTYTVADGLASNKVFDVAVGTDGMVWFATGEGVSRWDRATSTWAPYSEEEALTGYLVSRIQIAGDGSMWFSGARKATHLTFDKETSEPVWRSYDQYSARPTARDSVFFQEMVLAPDGQVWTRTAASRVIFLNRETGIWSRSSCCTWAISAFGLTESGGLWIGTHRDGVDFVPQPIGGKVDRRNLLHLDTTDGLASNDVRRIVVESDRIIWVGTDKGLSRCEIGQ